MICEEEKLIFSGQRFDARRPELKESKHKAHECCLKYNMLDERDVQRTDIVR